MNKSAVHKLILARRLFDLSQTNMRFENDIGLSIAINLLHDSLEAFLLGIMDNLNIDSSKTMQFEAIIDKVNLKITPRELPFRSRLIALNKLRINSKHYGIPPPKTEVSALALTIREFFEEVSTTTLGVSLSTVSLLDLINTCSEKEYLITAQSQLSNREYAETLINCRKAIYIRFEHSYDVSDFADDSDTLGWISQLGCKAPIYARTQDYIEKTVISSTDFIVIDHSRLDMDLIKGGIDNTMFWNVWRLTPDVYLRNNNEWVIKRDLRKLDELEIEERAHYVFDSTINIFIADDQSKLLTKSPRYETYYVDILGDNVPLYKKADKSSELVGYIPKTIRTVSVDHYIEGMSDSSIFWHVNHFIENHYLDGYISSDNVVENSVFG